MLINPRYCGFFLVWYCLVQLGSLKQNFSWHQTWYHGLVYIDQIFDRASVHWRPHCLRHGSEEKVISLRSLCDGTVGCVDHFHV